MGNIIKRDGRSVVFDRTKIINAILKASESLKKYDSEEDQQDIKLLSESIADSIEKICTSKDNLSVEDIQDIIEKRLMSSKYKDIAKAYILYRNDRSRIRQSKSKLGKAITKRLLALDVQNQNANMDEKSFGGRLGEVRSEVTKDYALNYCMSKMSRENHLNNEIYIHDLDSYAVGLTNCMSVPIDDLLANGFTIRNTDIRPAQSVNSAMQLVAVLFQIQSLQQFGGVAATHLDHSMVPYVRKSFFKHFKDGLKYVEELDLDE